MERYSSNRKNVVSRTDNSIYTGTYKDCWFGSVSITEKNGKMWFESKRSPSLSGEMFHYKTNTFVVKWSDRSLDADAYVMFCLDKTGKASGFRMSPISPLTDFSFDFQDLDFADNFSCLTRKMISAMMSANKFAMTFVIE
jgi:hypothetical protein